MTSKKVLVALCACALLMPQPALAQSESEKLAEQWRAAKRRELTAELQRVRAELQALNASVTPDTSRTGRPGDEPFADDESEKTKLAGGSAISQPTADESAVGQFEDAADVGSAEKENEKKAEERQVKQEEQNRTSAFQDFGGLRLGVGLSYTSDLGNRDRVGSAEEVNGIVRISDENNGRARIMFESHYFFTPCGDLLWLKNECYDLKDDVKRWGFGPFVAIEPGGPDNTIINAIGMGMMIGFRRDEKTRESFNIGAGIVIDPNVKVLGDGILANAPLPLGETQARLKDVSQTGWFLLTSFSF